MARADPVDENADVLSARSILGCGLALGAAVTCAADQGTTGAGATAIDAGFSDRSPLSVSLKQVAPDLRTDTGFERIYQLPGEGGLFMRRDGAMSAVFPESVYEWIRVSKYRWRQAAAIPPSTVFIIGDPNDHLPGMKPPAELFGIAPPTPPPSAALRPTQEQPLTRPVAGMIDGLVRTGPLPAASAPAAPPERDEGANEPAAEARRSSPPPRDMSSEVFRRERLRDIARRLGPQRGRAG